MIVEVSKERGRFTVEEFTRVLVSPERSEPPSEGWMTAPGDIDDFIFYVQGEWVPSDR